MVEPDGGPVVGGAVVGGAEVVGAAVVGTAEVGTEVVGAVPTAGVQAAASVVAPALSPRRADLRVRRFVLPGAVSTAAVGSGVSSIALPSAQAAHMQLFPADEPLFSVLLGVCCVRCERELPPAC